MAVVSLPRRVVWQVRGGADLVVRYRWTAAGSPVDLSRWSPRLMARSSVSSRAVLLDWGDDHVSLGSDGLVSVDATGAETAAWPWSEAVADLDLTDPADGRVVPFVRAQIVVTAGVIRD
jgi:hypothetical protein